MSILFASVSKKKNESQSSDSDAQSNSKSVKTSIVSTGSTGEATSETKTLLEYSAVGVQGNFTQITRIIQEKISSAQGISQMSYVYDGFYFHYITMDAIIYLCLTNEEFPRRKAFDFLAELQKEYQERVSGQSSDHEDIERILSFHPTLQGLVQKYSQVDALERAQQDVAQVRTIMSQNIEKVLNRGERIDSLVDRTESLQQQSLAFRSSTRNIAKEMWWKDMKVKIVGGSIISLVVLALFLYRVAMS